MPLNHFQVAGDNALFKSRMAVGRQHLADDSDLMSHAAAHGYRDLSLL
jgi:hypothetical protein